MGNQQETNLKTEDLAWLAGMLNGDGCMALNVRRKRNGNVACDVSFTLTQSDPCIINHAYKLVENLISGTPYINSRDASGGKWNKVYNLKVGKMTHIAQLLPNIIPYMIGAKKSQAEILERYVRHRLEYAGEHGTRMKVSEDRKGLGIAEEFYSVKNKKFPKDLLDSSETNT
jgi:hypothetical protein